MISTDRERTSTMISFLLYLACPLGVFALSVKNPNHALFEYSEQSSTEGNQNAGRANDGATTAWDGDCSQTTGKDPWNWWMVDMGEDFTVKSVRIADIRFCCNGSLNNFSIEVSTENPKTLDGFPGLVKNANACLVQTEAVPNTHPMAYHCDAPTTGRYVRLVQYNPAWEPMYLCELEVYSYYESNITVYPPSSNNLALNKRTAQSSTYLVGSSEQAVDGNLNPLWKEGEGSCTHTDASENIQWWGVDLGQVYVMDKFHIVNRGDCCQKRLREFTIEVSTDNPRHYEGFPGRTSKSSECLTQIDPINYNGAPVTLKCDKPVVGRYVRIVKLSNEALSVCEFEAFELKRRFAYVGGSQLSGGSVNENSPEARHYITRCVRQFKQQYYDVSGLFVHVDLANGECRYLDNLLDGKDITSSSWVVYRYD